MTEVKVVLDGRSYIWTGSEWCEAGTYVLAPEAAARRLNHELDRQLEAEDNNCMDFDVLLTGASLARDALQLGRAERLARRCLRMSPGHAGAAAVLCSVLRAFHRPQQALDETDWLRGSDYSPLLTSRAAAYCDLKRWEEAKKEVGQALAIGPSEEAFCVVWRIKAARPDLYAKRK